MSPCAEIGWLRSWYAESTEGAQEEAHAVCIVESGTTFGGRKGDSGGRRSTPVGGAGVQSIAVLPL